MKNTIDVSLEEDKLVQTRKGSIVETLMNTATGFVITLLFSPLIYFLAGVEASVSEMGLATFLFTILSVIRGYFIRRFFNKKKI